MREQTSKALSLVSLLPEPEDTSRHYSGSNKSGSLAFPGRHTDRSGPPGYPFLHLPSSRASPLVELHM